MKRMKRMLSVLKSTFTYHILSIMTAFYVSSAYAANSDINNSDPWDRALNAVLQIMTGPTATTVGAIALAGTGYLFLRGRIDVMRLLAIIAGLGIIFGAPHLAQLLQQHATG